MYHHRNFICTSCDSSIGDDLFYVCCDSNNPRCQQCQKKTCQRCGKEARTIWSSCYQCHAIKRETEMFLEYELRIPKAYCQRCVKSCFLGKKRFKTGHKPSLENMKYFLEDFCSLCDVHCLDSMYKSKSGERICEKCFKQSQRDILTGGVSLCMVCKRTNAKKGFSGGKTGSTTICEDCYSLSDEKGKSLILPEPADHPHQISRMRRDEESFYLSESLPELRLESTENCKWCGQNKEIHCEFLDGTVSCLSCYFKFPKSTKELYRCNKIGCKGIILRKFKARQIAKNVYLCLECFQQTQNSQQTKLLRSNEISLKKIKPMYNGKINQLRQQPSDKKIKSPQIEVKRGFQIARDDTIKLITQQNCSKTVKKEQEIRSKQNTQTLKNGALANDVPPPLDSHSNPSQEPNFLGKRQISLAKIAIIQNASPASKQNTEGSPKDSMPKVPSEKSTTFHLLIFFRNMKVLRAMQSRIQLDKFLDLFRKLKEQNAANAFISLKRE